MPIADPWLPMARDDSGVQLRLFCLPYAGGSFQIYGPWRDALPAGVQVVPLQPPGRAGRSREPLLRSVRAIAAAAADAVAALLDRPYAVFGHSLGAKVGFEFARLLTTRHGVAPRHLFVSGSRAPHLLHRRPYTHMLAPEEFHAELVRLGGTPPEILADPDLMAFLAPLLRAEFEASETYVDVGADRLPCKITAIGGEEDAIGPGEMMAWRDRCTGAFDFHLFPGGHFFIQTERPAVLRTVARALSADLEALSRR